MGFEQLMNSTLSTNTSNESISSSFPELQLEFNTLKQRYLHNKQPNLAQRKSVLKALKKALLDNKQSLMTALNEDYGTRTEFDSLMADILPSVQHLNYTLKNLKSWMKPEKRKSGLLLAPSTIYVHKQSLGVVGVVVPWNFPVFLSVGPIVTALAAGNKVMVKLSEYTPKTNAVIRHVFQSISENVSIIEGGPEVAASFTQLPFDHVFFTGSTSVGRLVAQSCANQLIPNTLELGGKSPVVISPNSDLTKAADAILLGKSVNAGQICVAPDYILVEKSQYQAFCQTYLARFSELYNSANFAQEYGAIINQAQFDRLLSVLNDAENKGAKILSPTGYQIDNERRIMPPQLLTEVTDDMLACQDEIFGPLLPVIPFDAIEDAIEYINNKPRPLALYIMSNNDQVTHQILTNTHSGGVCINDTLMHVGADDSPFGGIGESGIGNYHGREGFETFCHKRTVLKTPSWLPRSTLILKSKGLALNLLSKIFIR